MCVGHPFCPVQPQFDLIPSEQLHWSILGIQGLARGDLNGGNDGEQMLLCQFYPVRFILQPRGLNL